MGRVHDNDGNYSRVGVTNNLEITVWACVGNEENTGGLADICRFVQSSCISLRISPWLCMLLFSGIGIWTRYLTAEIRTETYENLPSIYTVHIGCVYLIASEMLSGVLGIC
jgi:hypothetical protein